MVWRRWGLRASAVGSPRAAHGRWLGCANPPAVAAAADARTNCPVGVADWPTCKRRGPQVLRTFVNAARTVVIRLRAAKRLAMLKAITGGRWALDTGHGCWAGGCSSAVQYGACRPLLQDPWKPSSQRLIRPMPRSALARHLSPACHS